MQIDVTGVDGPALMTDEEIVSGVVGGNTALFEILMRRHNQRVYRVARAIVRDESEAEDVMQQAYVNAYAQLRQFKAEAQFATWLIRITVNEALARLRLRNRYRTYAEEASRVDAATTPEGLRDPEREAAAGELHTLLEWAVDRLPGGAREVFVMREVEGMSTAEVAESLDVSADVVKTRLSRARASIRRDLLARTGATAGEAFRFYKPRCDRVVTSVFSRLALPLLHEGHGHST